MKAGADVERGAPQEGGASTTPGQEPDKAQRPGRLFVVNRHPSPSGNHVAVVEHYRRLAAKYDRRWDRYTQRTLTAVVDSLELRPGHPLRILDVACGTGRLTEMIRNQEGGDAAHVTGVDLSPQMIDVARARMPETPGVEWGIAPAEDLPAADASYDAVTCANAFHLVTDAGKALAEFRRVLKPGGRLIIIDWCREYPTMALLLACSRMFGRQFRRIETVGQLSRRLEEAGFGVVSTGKLKATWFWGLMCVVAEKR